MHEIELKFQIPVAARAAVTRAVTTATATHVRLRAVYLDTPGRDLAAAGMALRLRLEGRRWVQTLKAGGATAMQRLEDNVPVAGARVGSVPAVDPARHAGTPAGERLAAVLAALPQPVTWVAGYATDIRRTVRRVRVPGGMVELALDNGRIEAGGQVLPVHELEFELLRGTPRALTTLAATWVARHGLWLDVRSKAERGDRLARGVVTPPAVKAGAAALAADLPAAAALRAMLRVALNQTLANAAEVAGGTAGPEHVHQLRVGLRRLRSLLRELTDWDPSTDPAWEPALAQTFGALGAARDRDALTAAFGPVWQAVGAPPLPLPTAADAPDPGDTVRAATFQATLLALLAQVSEAAEAPTDTASSAAEPPLAERAAATLNRLHRRAARDVDRFDTLPEDERHRLRKRLKRLRYVADALASLFPRKRVAAYLAALRAAQEALGRANDVATALALYRADVAERPQAWFAVGWLTAQAPALAADSRRTLHAWRDARRFWR